MIQITENFFTASREQWRALHFFNLYRLFLSGILVALSLANAHPSDMGAANPGLFNVSAAAMAFISAINLATISRGSPAFVYQATFQIIADIVIICLLMHSSGGVGSGLEVLMLISVAASGVVLSRRMTLFCAAFATIAMLLEQAYGAYLGFPDYGQFTRVGLIGLGFFATAFVVMFLSNRIRVSEAVLEKQALDIHDLAQFSTMVIQRLPIGAIVVNRAGRIKMINEVAERYLGVKHAVQGVLISDIHPDLNSRLQSYLVEPMKPVAPVFMKSAGFEAQPRLIPISRDRMNEIIIFLEDSSEVNKRAQQIKLAALGRLTGAIAHEIRNPLSAIRQAGQLLEESDSLDSNDRRLSQIVQKQSDRINRIIGSVLELGRGDPPKFSHVPLRKWLDDFARDFSLTSSGKNAELFIEGEETVAMANQEYLGQIISNLTQNAVKYGAENQAQPRVILQTGRLADTGQAYIDVIDFGPGIPEDARARLFEPFFTLSSEGTGLGLFIARELSEAINASLEIVPQEESGAQFRVVFREQIK